MSRYIKLVLNPGNELRTDVNISIGSLNLIAIANINVKIDTGCPYTSIPIQKLGISKLQAQIMKRKDSDDMNIKKEISFGVNDTQKDRQIAMSLFKNRQYMKLKQVTFIHNDLDIEIGKVNIHKKDVKISYDRTGNILLGMDILKDWDIHIGTIDTGETIFLGCPKTQINDDYLQELEKTFHIASDINALFIRQKIHK